MKIKIIFPSEDVIGKVIFLGGLNLYNWIKSKDHAINVKSLLISHSTVYHLERLCIYYLAYMQLFIKTCFPTQCFVYINKWLNQEIVPNL